MRRLGKEKEDDLVRGGINLMHRLKPEERRRGVVTASTGNHALSIAYADSVLED
jgi:threonine dehydratase